MANGNAQVKKHTATFARAGQRYGVPAKVITAFREMERPHPLLSDALQASLLLPIVAVALTGSRRRAFGRVERDRP